MRRRCTYTDLRRHHIKPGKDGWLLTKVRQGLVGINIDTALSFADRGRFAGTV